MSNEVINAPAGGLSGISSERFAALAQKAKDVAAKERPSISKISLKAGVMALGGQPIKDNKLDAVVLVAAYRNTYYKDRYDANNIVNPDCFAFSMSDEDLAPAAGVVHPQHPKCEGCPNAEWGSDRNGGRGKACKETRRLVLLPANALESKESVQTGELAIMDVPVTSVKHYASYVNVLAASIGLPPHACITEISARPDAKTQFRVDFKGVSPVPSEQVLDAIEARQPEATRIALLGYEKSNDEEEGADESTPAAPAKPAAKKKY